MVLRHLVVHGGGGPLAAVGGVALHNGGIVQGLHQLPDKLRAQVVAPRLPGGQLHGDVPGGAGLQGLIYRHEALGGQIRGHKNIRISCIGCLPLLGNITV